MGGAVDCVLDGPICDARPVTTADLSPLAPSPFSVRSDDVAAGVSASRSSADGGIEPFQRFEESATPTDTPTTDTEADVPTTPVSGDGIREDGSLPDAAALARQISDEARTAMLAEARRILTASPRIEGAELVEAIAAPMPSPLVAELLALLDQFVTIRDSRAGVLRDRINDHAFRGLADCTAHRSAFLRDGVGTAVEEGERQRAEHRLAVTRALRDVAPYVTIVEEPRRMWSLFSRRFFRVAT
jgi:hypothetical protein